MKAIQRFWNKVDKRTEDECWIWMGAKVNGGYGCITVDSENIVAHRYSWIIHNGNIPAGLLVCHHCDNPPCVNPIHLFLGTNSDNTLDMVEKNRHAKTHKTTKTRKTKCKYGHEFTEENSSWFFNIKGYYVRNCKTCAKIRRDSKKSANKADSK